MLNAKFRNKSIKRLSYLKSKKRKNSKPNNNKKIPIINNIRKLRHHIRETFNIKKENMTYKIHKLANIKNP